MEVFILILIFSVCLGSEIIKKVENTTQENHDNFNTLDVQIDDRWILKHDFKHSSINPKENKTHEPYDAEKICARKPLRKPDFKASGNRISVQKCDEYKWNIYNRAYENERFFACEELMDKYAVIGGTFTLPGEFAHMGAVGWQEDDGTWDFKCGSTLISSKFVLTAGHCTRFPGTLESAPKIIRFTDITRKYRENFLSESTSITRNISRMILHPQYKPPVKYFDVALMELDEEIQFNEYIHPACLWPEFDTDALGWEATVTGWGVTDKRTKKTSLALLKATVDIIESDECDELLEPHRNRHWNGVVESQICAGILEGGVDTCQGDSGGPLQIHVPQNGTQSTETLYYVIGVTSFGYECAEENTPGLYTRVSAVLDWIESVVWPGEIIQVHS